MQIVCRDVPPVFINTFPSSPQLPVSHENRRGMILPAQTTSLLPQTMTLISPQGTNPFFQNGSADDTMTDNMDISSAMDQTNTVQPPWPSGSMPASSTFKYLDNTAECNHLFFTNGPSETLSVNNNQIHVSLNQCFVYFLSVSNLS